MQKSVTIMHPGDSENKKHMRDCKRRRFYGRRHGKTLRSVQRGLMDTLFPELEITRPGTGEQTTLQTLFRRPVKEVWLEIGFGGGEHLAAQAESRPDVGFIGAEPFVNGIGKLLSHVQSRNLDNIRIYGDDVRPWLDTLPDACLDRVFLLFPDPWPKTRHRERRFINPWNLDLLARVMKDNAVLRVASDDPTYVRHTLAVAPVHPLFCWNPQRPADWRIHWADAVESRYEAKAHREGRVPHYFTFHRIPRG